MEWVTEPKSISNRCAVECNGCSEINIILIVGDLF